MKTRGRGIYKGTSGARCPKKERQVLDSRRAACTLRCPGSTGFLHWLQQTRHLALLASRVSMGGHADSFEKGLEFI